MSEQEDIWYKNSRFRPGINATNFTKLRFGWKLLDKCVHPKNLDKYPPVNNIYTLIWVLRTNNLWLKSILWPSEIIITNWNMITIRPLQFHKQLQSSFWKKMNKFAFSVMYIVLSNHEFCECMQNSGLEIGLGICTNFRCLFRHVPSSIYLHNHEFCEYMQNSGLKIGLGICTNFA
jgi:hypothetical protein